MIAAGSFVGFVLASALLAWTLSALAGALVASQRRRLAARGPAAERAAAAVALVAPPVLAATAIAAIALAQLGGVDHCEAHAHHLHLCLAHGGEWASRVVPVALVAGLAAALAIRCAGMVARLVAARRIVTSLRRGGRARRAGGCELVVVPSPHRLSMTAGVLTPRVYVSTAVWDVLDDDERAAVLAHESAHARARDVLWRLVLGAFAALAAPGIGARLVATWSAATERLRDQDAAIAIGDAAVVGSALLKVARVPAAPPLAASAGLSADADLAGRVEALLDAAPIGAASARRIGRLAWVVGAVALVLAVIAAGPIHHALETLLAPL